jgi:hypothetical protein
MKTDEEKSGNRRSVISQAINLVTAPETFPLNSSMNIAAKM